jgi:hypothetical protein
MTEEVIEEVIDARKVDFYLRLSAESDMPTVLADFYRQDYITNVDEEGVETQVTDGDPYLVAHSHDYAIVDVVGTLHEPTGNTLTDEEGNEYPETALVSGWHVNIRLVGDAMRETVEALDATHGITPNSPSRVWL